jgi:hypothetical protein
VEKKHVSVLLDLFQEMVVNDTYARACKQIMPPFAGSEPGSGILPGIYKVLSVTLDWDLSEARGKGCNSDGKV